MIHHLPHNCHNHNDLGLISVELRWEGNGNQVVLVKAAAYEKNSWFKYCCLWGPAFKNMHVLSPIECITPTGRAQGLGPAIKLFNQMIRSAQTLNMS